MSDEALQAARRQPLREPRAPTEAQPEACCCDLGAEGCLKPSLLAPEPAPPYSLWVCNARRHALVCTHQTCGGACAPSVMSASMVIRMHYARRSLNELMTITNEGTDWVCSLTALAAP